MEVASQVAQMEQFVRDAAREGVAAHDVELALFRRVMALGRSLLGAYLASQGSGDVGEHFVMPDGEVLPRDPEPRDREYTTIFGSFTLTRTVYSEGRNQKLVVPLDARLQLPESMFRQLLQIGGPLRSQCDATIVNSGQAVPSHKPESSRAIRARTSKSRLAWPGEDGDPFS